MFEQLETRRLMTVTVSVSYGTLRVYGDTAANDLEVRYDSALGKFIVNIDGTDKIVQTTQSISKINLKGNSGNDRLVIDDSVTIPTTVEGGNGNDTLVGGRGRDTLRGDYGNDTADYSGRIEDLSLSLNGAADDGAAGEKDNISGSVENLIGGAGRDILVGNSSANKLDGGDGDDYINAGGGNDTLIGGAGEDVLLGGSGNDRIIADDGEQDILLGGSGTNIATYDDLDVVMI